MARQYPPMSFIRHASNQCLQQYFEKYSIPTKIDWQHLREENAQPVYEALRASDDVFAKAVSNFRRIASLADDGGMERLRSVACEQLPPIDLVPQFNRLSGRIDRAFWTFLNHEGIFNLAQRLDEAHKLPSETRDNLPPIDFAPNEEGKSRLEALLTDHYSRTEGRGQACVIDVDQIGGRYHYYCHLEDYSETKLTFKDHAARMEQQSPAFEVVLVYDPIHRTLETMVRGGQQARADIEAIFGEAILEVTLPPSPGRRIVYQLDPLLRRDFKFHIFATDRIEKVLVRRLKLRVRRSIRTVIVLEVAADAPEKEIWDVMKEYVQTRKLPFHMLTVEQAAIRVMFAPDEKGRRSSLTFEVSNPRACSLDSADPKGALLKNCLKRWKLDVSGPGQDHTVRAGLPAQFGNGL